MPNDELEYLPFRRLLLQNSIGYNSRRMSFQCCTYIVVCSLLRSIYLPQSKNNIDIIALIFLGIDFLSPLPCQRRHSFWLLLVFSGYPMMTTQKSSRRSRCTGFLGDPRYTAMRLTATWLSLRVFGKWNF